MKVVRAGHEDIPAIHQLICQTISAIYPNYYPTDVVRFFLDYHSRDRITEALDQELIIMINKDDLLIGTGSLFGNEIKRMFVLPEFQKKGYGSLLLNKLERKAAGNGYLSVELDASLPAYGLYESKGYLPIKNEQIVTQSGQVLFYYRMAKRIGIRNKSRAETHYYNDRLKSKLSKLSDVRAAVVEAPSGYGKTTALRDFLETGPARNALVYWFAAANEAPTVNFRRLCDTINKIDSDAGKCLRKIELPNANNIGEVCNALRSIRCRQQTYLVIDNFQLMQTALPPHLLSALLEHGGEGLHVIITTQLLEPHLLDAISGLSLLHITRADLGLDASDIRRYYNRAGLNLTLEEAQSVADLTEGWIIAVNLQMRAFAEKGTFFERTGVLTLIEHLIWDPLTEDQQTFLLSLSPFETVTTQQICNLARWKRLPEFALSALNNPLIRYEPVRRFYELHNILTELLNMKRSERGDAFERECLTGAGDLYRNEGDLVKAFGFYNRVGDYEQMFALDLSRLALEKIGTIPFAELARNIALNCPANIRKKHPLAMLRIAWALLNAGMNAEFNGLMEEIRLMMKTGGDAGGDGETSHLLGEWMLLSSFGSFPYLEEMIAVLKEAEGFFIGQCSQVIRPTIPWWFGTIFPFTEFHAQSGQADREADLFEEYITLYAKLTGGHGSGADALFRAELAYNRGNLGDAEIFAYKAAYFAECNQQSMVLLGAAMRLAEIALHKADAVGWQRAIDSMERATSFDTQDTFIVRSAIDIVRGILLNELQNQKNIADWLKDGDFPGKQLPPAMTSNALFVHLSYLMHQAEYVRLVGTAQALYPNGLSAQPFRELFFSLTVAVGELALNNCAKAATLVGQAAKAALPDGLLFPFASYTWLLGGLTEDLVAREYPALFGRFSDIKKRFWQGWTTLRQFVFLIGLSPVLSPREYEVAKLAAEGLHNDEIAARLTVSENTVRAHLRVIFQKLDIDRRAKLAEKLK
mgnify:FL=1